MTYQIFISYRRIGGDALAFLIKERLQQIGYSVFFDVESLHSGKFSEELKSIINECDSFLLILNQGALDRCNDENDWLYKEILCAINMKKNIIPIFTNGFEWPSSLPDSIRDLPYYNGISVNYEFFDSFINKLDVLIHDKTPVQNIDRENKKHVLIWADFEVNIINRIVKRMNLPEEYTIEILLDPIEILSKDLSTINSIIIIDTDVTKLSNNDYTLERINRALEQYVSNGGKLITTHDTIYRRTRNTILQNMIGCQLINFKQIKEVQYNKTEDCIQLNCFSEMPDSFMLLDDEICWGDTLPDVVVYFESEDKLPLVFSREYGSGICFWLNSGEYKKYPSESILKPDKNFVDLLKNILLGDF